MEKVDLYSTHLEYINSVFEFKGSLKNIVEFGMGNYSTELLINNGDNVISIEMQSDEWYDKMVDNFSDKKNWTSYKLIGPYTFKEINYPEFVDMSFVDGHGGSRPDCINFMMDMGCPIIFSHDTEEPGYQWYRVKDNTNYKKIEFKKYSNWTTVWTTDIKLFDFLSNKYSNEFIL